MGQVSENDDKGGYGGGTGGGTGRGSAGGAEGKAAADRASQSRDQGKGGYGASDSKRGDPGLSGDKDSALGGSEKEKSTIDSLIDTVKSTFSGLTQRAGNYAEDTMRTLGLSDQYDYERELSERAKKGMLSPTEHEIHQGMLNGKAVGIAEKAFGSMAPAPSGAVSAGIQAAEGLANMAPHADYGYSRGKRATESGLVGDVAGAVGGLVAGPAGKAMGEMTAASVASNSIQSASPSNAPTNTSRNEGGNALQVARAAFTSPAQTQPTQNPTSRYSSVNLSAYNKGMHG